MCRLHCDSSFKMALKFVFLFALLTPIQAQLSLQALFPHTHKLYTYVVSSSVCAGAVRANGSCWTLDGVLQARQRGDTVRFQLKELKVSAQNDNHGAVNYHTDEAAAFLSQPWEMDTKAVCFYNNAKANCLHVGAEPVWSVNIKRAISVNFQLRQQNGTYTDREACLHGSCLVSYVTQGSTVRKYTNLQLSPWSMRTSWSSIPIVDYYLDGVPDSIVTAERIYDIDEKRGLQSLELKGELQYKANGHILTVATQLSMYFVSEMPAHSSDKLNLTRTSLEYASHDFRDPTNSIKNITQQQLKNKSDEILLKIAKKGIDADNIVRNGSVIHSMDFINLLNTMSQLNYASLKKLFDDMVLGTSYEVETCRNIFLEVLPHIRTRACALFIKHLVVEEKEKVEDATLLTLIRKLPYNVVELSQSLLEELEVFTKLGLDVPSEIRHAGILSFATLVYKTKEASRRGVVIKQDYFDKIVVKYFRMYSDCPQYIDRLVWLQGLSNIGHSAESYTRTIYVDKSRDRHERVWAAQYGSQFTYGDTRSYPVLETTLPILMDDNEHIQLRVVALQNFLNSVVTASDFMFVHNYITQSPNNHLKRFWYKSVKSLEKSKLGDGAGPLYVRFLTNQVTDPGSEYWGTNNFITSTVDETGSGAEFQLISVANSVTGIPDMMSFKLRVGRGLAGRTLQAALYIIAEGVATNIFFKLRDIPKTIDVERLAKLLKDLKIQINEKEKIHVDIVLKIHDQTVYVTHIDHLHPDSSTSDELKKTIEDFFRFGSHINQQIVYYPHQMYVNTPTELGTPLRFQSTTVSFTSIRGNLTAPGPVDVYYKNDMHIRYQGTSVTQLSTDAPLLQSEHSVLIQNSIVAHLPLKFDITFMLFDKIIELIWLDPGIYGQNGGIAMHSRAQVACDTAAGRDVVTISSSPFSYESQQGSVFFDCEQPTLIQFLTSKKYNFIAFLRPPFPCGLALPPPRSPPPAPAALHIVMRLQQLDFDAVKMNLNLEHSFIYRDSSPDGEIYINITGHTDYTNFAGNSSLEILNIIAEPSSRSQRSSKFCFQQSSVADNSDVFSSAVSGYSGVITLSYLSKSGVNVSPLSCPADGSNLSVKYKYTPREVNDAIDRELNVNAVGHGLTPLGSALLSEIKSDSILGQILGFDWESFNITAIIKEKNEVTNISINHGSPFYVNSESLGWLDYWSYNQVLKQHGFYGVCYIEKSDHIIADSDAKTDDILLLADCTDTPRFIILRVSGGFRFYSASQELILKHDSIEIPPNINKEWEIHIIGNALSVFGRTSGVRVLLTRTHAAILAPHAYSHAACGRCRA